MRQTISVKIDQEMLDLASLIGRKAVYSFNIYIIRQILVTKSGAIFVKLGTSIDDHFQITAPFEKVDLVVTEIQ